MGREGRGEETQRSSRDLPISVTHPVSLQKNQHLQCSSWHVLGPEP